MVSLGDPGTPVTVSWAPICSPGPRTLFSTIWSGWVGQWPDFEREVVDRTARRRAADEGQLLLEDTGRALAGRRGERDMAGDGRLGEGPGGRRHPRQVRGGG